MVALACLFVGTDSTSATAATSCPTYQFIGVRGSGEKNVDAGGYGSTVAAVKTKVLQQRGGGTASFVDYPAVPVTPGDQKYVNNYKLSVNQGINTLSSFVAAFHTRCKAAAIVLVGYSQGAHVAGNVYQSVSQAVRDKVVALVMFGDPRFNPNQPVDYGSYGKKNGVFSRMIGGSIRSFQPSQFPTVRSYCLRHDPICNFSDIDIAKCGIAGHYCAHMHYVDTGYTNAAANWILTRIPAAPVVPPAPAPAPPQANPTPVINWYHIAGTCRDGACGLRVRNGPGYTSYGKVGTLYDGNPIGIVCQTTGQMVDNG
jgi:hypothetical protein